MNTDLYELCSNMEQHIGEGRKFSRLLVGMNYAKYNNKMIGINFNNLRRAIYIHI